MIDINTLYIVCTNGHHPLKAKLPMQSLRKEKDKGAIHKRYPRLQEGKEYVSSISFCGKLSKDKVQGIKFGQFYTDIFYESLQTTLCITLLSYRDKYARKDYGLSLVNCLIWHSIIILSSSRRACNQNPKNTFWLRFIQA